jgi:CoA:oxalate CoA-transferase
MMPQPLAGLKVVDFSHVMAGPFATHFMRLLGAEVIKIESPHGDIFRNYDVDARYVGMSPAFIAANAGKKSVVLDLKKPQDLEAAKRLIAQSDVLVENFRPGVMDRLGLGYEVCKALRPDIIFCSVSGYGQSGPMRDYPAIDNVVQATAGVMSVSGEPDGPPVRMGVPIVDTYAGTLAALAVMAALVHRTRFGEGQKIDVSMMDAALVMLTGAATPYLVKGEVPVRTGNTGFSAQPTSGLFRCSDGELISLGVVQQNQYEHLCRILGREDLIADVRFVDVRSRRAHARQLTAILEALFLVRGSEHWEAELSKVGCPCGVVRDVGAACELEQLKLRNLKLPITIPGLPDEQIHILNAGFVFEHDGPGVSEPPPTLGQHTREILESLGLPYTAGDAA